MKFDLHYIAGPQEKTSPFTSCVATTESTYNQETTARGRWHCGVGVTITGIAQVLKTCNSFMWLRSHICIRYFGAVA